MPDIPPLPDPLDWAEFITRRETALRLLEAGPDGDARRASPGLTAAMTAVQATEELLTAVGRPDLARIDYRVLQAMKDVSTGQLPAMFTPTFRVRGFENWEGQLIAISARAIDDLRRTGKSLDEAMKEVLPLVQAQMPEVDSKTITGWRSDLRKTNSPMPESVLQRYRAHPPPGVETDAKTLADFWLRQLRDAPALRNPRPRK